MSFLKKIFKNRTEIVKDQDRLRKMEELIEHLKTIDPKKVHGMVVSYVYKSEDKDDKGNEIYDLDTKMVGDSYTLLGINRGFQDALMHVLAEEAQANVLSNVEGVTKH